MTGTTVWFRGSFGFLRPDDGGPDVFVHFTGIAGPASQHKTLEGGDKVEFETDRRIEDNRIIAVNVRKLEANNGDGNGSVQSEQPHPSGSVRR